MYVYSDQDGNILRVSRSLNELSPLNVISVSQSAFPSLRDHPERYMVVAGRVVQRPYLEVSSSTSVAYSGGCGLHCWVRDGWIVDENSPPHPISSTTR